MVAKLFIVIKLSIVKIQLNIILIEDMEADKKNQSENLHFMQKKKKILLPSKSKELRNGIYSIQEMMVCSG